MEKRTRTRCNRFDCYLVSIHSLSTPNIHTGNCFPSRSLYLGVYLAWVDGMLTDTLRQRLHRYRPFAFALALLLSAMRRICFWQPLVGRRRSEIPRAEQGLKQLGPRVKTSQSMINWSMKECTTKKWSFVVECSWKFISCQLNSKI